MIDQSTFSGYAAHLREFIRQSSPREAIQRDTDGHFRTLALELFGLQVAQNPAYRKFCAARGVLKAGDWKEIPTVPTAAFKELDMTSLPMAERTRVFHSSGTTEQRPSRHFHSEKSLELYEASILPWFQSHLMGQESEAMKFIALTPPSDQAPNSSLVYMFETVGRRFAAGSVEFAGWAKVEGWDLDLPRTLAGMMEAEAKNCAVMVLGTAFNFVQLLDHLANTNTHIKLARGSRVLETGGYKGRSREMPKTELHALISEALGIAADNIVCEYGMSELSSQAYDRRIADLSTGPRSFKFPPWARVQIISPETGREVGEGETGLIRIFDLANVYSVMAIQTEDLGIRRGDGFELIGRAKLAESRGCSLMSA